MAFKFDRNDTIMKLQGKYKSVMIFKKLFFER